MKEVQVAMCQRRRLCRRSRDVQPPEARETGSSSVEQPPAVSRYGASVPHSGDWQPGQEHAYAARVGVHRHAQEIHRAALIPHHVHHVRNGRGANGAVKLDYL